MSGPRHRANRVGGVQLADDTCKQVENLVPGTWYVVRVEDGDVVYVEGSNGPDVSDPHILSNEYREVLVRTTTLTFQRVGSSTPRVHVFEVP